MVQLAKVLAAKHDKLTSIPGTHMVKGEHQLLQVFFYVHVCTPPTHSLILMINVKEFLNYSYYFTTLWELLIFKYNN